MPYELGPCDREEPYRYSLTVTTDSQSKKRLIVIQCNPSTATSDASDSTVGKVARWAGENGFGEINFLNLFALISPTTDALEGKGYEEIVGSRNDAVIKAQLQRKAGTVVLAWGKDIPVPEAEYRKRVQEVKALIDATGHQAHHVGNLSGGTHPRHGRMWNAGNRDLRLLDWDKVFSVKKPPSEGNARQLTTNSEQHFLNASFREKLIEHMLIGELLKLSWSSGNCGLEISKPEVDKKGYDLIMEDNGFMRHVQLKTSHRGSRTSRQKVHIALGEKPSGCVIWIFFDEDTLELGPFLFFGGAPNEPLPDISEFPIARHTRGNAEGVKAERVAIRVVGKSKFIQLSTIEKLYGALFENETVKFCV